MKRACMQEHVAFGAGRAANVDERVDAGSGGQNQRPVAGREGLGGLAVDRHDANLQVLQFERNGSAVTGVDEAKSEAFVGADRDCDRVGRRNAVNRMKSLGISGIGPRRNRRSIGADAPLLDQKDLVAVDRDRLALAHDQREPARRLGLAIAEQAEVAKTCTGVAQRQLKRLAAAGCNGRAGQQGLSGRNTVETPPGRQGRHRQVVGEGNVEGVAAAQSSLRSGQRPDVDGRPEPARPKFAGFGLQRKPGAALSQAGHRPYRRHGGCAQSGQQLTSVQQELRAGFGVCHRTDPDHFPRRLSSRDGLLPARLERAIFLLRTDRLMI
jgi:hypothetical protein